MTTQPGNRWFPPTDEWLPPGDTNGSHDISTIAARPHVLALAGSFRTDSLNQALLRAARDLAPAGVTFIDFDLRTIPFYDGDLEAAGEPAVVAALNAAIASADALLIATPEYNGSLPAVLKNAIDWVSRSPQSLLTGKPVAIMGATPGRGGTRRVQAHLREILERMGAVMLHEPTLYVERAHTLIAEGRLHDDHTRHVVRAVVVALVAVADEHAATTAIQDVPHGQLVSYTTYN